jgi:sucrose-6F-phosphate phosphohydrolase
LAEADEPANPIGRAVRWLLVSDLDETLTGDGPALQRLVEAVAGTPELAVAINSSRPLVSVDQTLAGFPPGWRPDALIGAMGTEIRLAGAPLRAWQARFEGWDRGAIDRAMEQVPGVEPHAADLQTPFKASFAVPPDRQQQATEAVRATGLAVQIVVSGESDFDVLPEAAGKEAATAYLTRQLGLDPASGLIVAGDSGNDLAMFRASAKGIVVANARNELRQAVSPEQTSFASQPRAAGVLEGLSAWGVPLGQPRG